MKYAFLKEHSSDLRLLSMCPVLKVHRNGHCTWLKEPQSAMDIVNVKLSAQVRYYCDQSMEIYETVRGFTMPSKKPESALVRTVWQDS